MNQNTKEIEVKYLFQDENEKGIIERRIYKEALDLEIINDEHFKELNDLYDLRNRVVHRYIISYLKTRDIKEIALDYYFLSEKIRLIIKSIEEEQMDRKIGIYGEGYEKDYKFTRDDQQVMFSLANDKHLLEEFQRKINKSS